MIPTKMILVTWLALALSCHSGLMIPQDSSQHDIPQDTLITLERTVCFGSCPDYKLTISADGTVVFEGRQYVKKKGRIESQVNQEQLKRLISEFEKANYFSLRDKYESTEGGCPTGWTDNPSATTSIRMNGKTKSIFHYYGCQDKEGVFVYPRELTNLESKIDEIVGTKKWIE